eukprot:scaffold311246_cov96-Cyclotella_meneghiniana.AAC.3
MTSPAASTTMPPFRLLLHSRDGCIPHLTPRLVDQIFRQDDESRRYRDHVVLGIAVRDTCIAPVYSNKRNRDDDRLMYESKKRRTCEPRKKDSSSSVNDTPSNSNKVSDAKKPSGYTFLTPDKTRAICEAVNSNDALTPTIDKEKHAMNYIHDYLRVPSFIQTMVVPTFAFINGEDDDNKRCGNGNTFISSKSSDNKQYEKNKQQYTNKKKDIIPKGSQNAVAIDTPHGWQSITPEQYGGAVASLDYSCQDKVASSVGTVGLFDHIDITNHAHALFSDHCLEKDSGIPDQDETSGADAVATLTKQAMKKITTSFQKCTSWTRRVQTSISSSGCFKDSPIWSPVNIFSSFLPAHVLAKSFLDKNGQRDQLSDYNVLSESSNVAIVGWEALPSNIHHSKKQAELKKLIQRIQSMPSTKSQQPPKQFLLLAVNDVASILDASREGVSIIGTDLVRSLSIDGIALTLDFTLPTSDIELTAPISTGGRINLNEKQYANDCKPLIQGCACLTCRFRTTSNRAVGYQHFATELSSTEPDYPSFSRAYIHHLIQANEMLADTLLFIHNLHQMVILFHKLSEARAASQLESLCLWVEKQL